MGAEQRSLLALGVSHCCSLVLQELRSPRANPYAMESGECILPCMKSMLGCLQWAFWGLDGEVVCRVSDAMRETRCVFFVICGDGKSESGVVS